MLISYLKEETNVVTLIMYEPPMFRSPLLDWNIHLFWQRFYGFELKAMSFVLCYISLAKNNSPRDFITARVS